MGGFTSKTEQDLKVYLEKDYQIDNYPFLVHRTNKKKAFVHQIVTDSRQEAQRIRRDVNLYKYLMCKSISVILQYVPLQSSKICSEQEYHYILEEREHTQNLKEQFFARKYYKERFSKQEIINIIKTYLCGLQVYHKQFHRSLKGFITLDSITVDEPHSNHLRMTDPLLMSEFNTNLSSKSSSIQSHSTPSNPLEQQNSVFQAPERMEVKKTRFNETQLLLNQLLADVYSVGIIALQLYKMELFDQKQKVEQLLNQIQNIKDPELKKTITLMTASNPDQRKQVYQLLHVSSTEIYHLSKTFSKGNLNKDISITTNFNSDQQNTVKRENHLKKQNSYSFGTAVQPQIFQQQTFQQQNHFQQQTSQQQNHIPSLIKPFQKSNKIFVNNFPTDRLYNRISHEKIIQKKSNLTSQNPLIIPPLKLTDKQSISNVSTQRTFAVPTLNNTSRSNPKPVVKFSNSTSITIPSLLPSTNTVPPSYDQSLITNKYSNASKIDSFFNKQTIQPRTNSFLFNESKLPIKLNDESLQLKKHHNTSPISHYQSSQQKNNFNKMLDQQNNKLTQNKNLSPSPYKPTSDKKVEQQISKLLKQPIHQQNKASQTVTPLSHINNFSLIPQQSNSSPIHVLESNQGTTFISREKIVNQSNLLSTTQNFPIYRPNKEVEQILKRLGIGSLLYGEEKNEDDKNNKNDLEIKKTQQQEPKHDQVENQVHQGVYRIPNPSKNQQTSDKHQAPERDAQIEQMELPEVNSLTPIKAPKKPKFNSTIVEVGDQDSQYSQSVKNNDETPVDLTHHEYVVEEYQTGSRYQGYKLNGQRDGEGKFFYQDGGYYEGQWRANKMHGWGRLYYEGGKLAYQGNWSQDEFHGFGKVYNDNPIQLECGFDFTNFDLLEDYWEFYEGMLVKDTKEGRGKIMLTNSEMFEGDFHNDRIQGFGKFFMKDGTVVEGIWRDSKLIKIIS